MNSRVTVSYTGEQTIGLRFMRQVEHRGRCFHFNGHYLRSIKEVDKQQCLNFFPKSIHRSVNTCTVFSWLLSLLWTGHTCLYVDKNICGQFLGKSQFRRSMNDFILAFSNFPSKLDRCGY